MLDHQYIKKLAADAGFDLCGLAPCRHLVENESMLRAWLGKGYQSSLAYMERNVEKRADPRKLVEGARTAVVCAAAYPLVYRTPDRRITPLVVQVMEQDRFPQL